MKKEQQQQQKTRWKIRKKSEMCLTREIEGRKKTLKEKQHQFSKRYFM